ncbi:MAG: hypothetical protein COV36_08260 [Alphaproteobacteria bacterium CG11_big_fil_rev_8_21_14_0_20_44_7]|nr:MAG: hypothetical protein COV36_08260 [Alphaproteobacteria bacterium CG11_big_fil_rev_8_21_14_0_20_44_7]
MNNKDKKGFTLVELSIVLVIIGLLIGGILVAQSMIETTKIQSLTRQIGQFDAAVSTFVDKFNALPGDNTLFDATGDADGNGTIQDDGTALAENSGEIAQFWNDLSNTGLKNEGGAAYAATEGAVTINTTAPQAKAGSNAAVVAFGVSGVNYYQLQNMTAMGDATFDNGADAFKPSAALAIDTKMDDGNAGAGYVMAAEGTGLNDVALTADATSGDGECVGSTTAVYDVAYDSDDCQLRIRIGSSTGNLQ